MAAKAIHAGNLPDPIFGEVSVPVFQTSTFSFPSADDGAAQFAGESDGYIYTRMGNPTIKALEDNVAILESGYKGLATASGMAAITTVFLAILNKGDHLAVRIQCMVRHGRCWKKSLRGLGYRPRLLTVRILKMLKRLSGRC